MQALPSNTLPTRRALPESFLTLFERPKRVEKAAGLSSCPVVLFAHFAKPLKTRSRSLHSVAPSSSNTTRFAIPNVGDGRSDREERRRAFAKGRMPRIFDLEHLKTRKRAAPFCSALNSTLFFHIYHVLFIQENLNLRSIYLPSASL